MVCGMIVLGLAFIEFWFRVEGFRPSGVRIGVWGSGFLVEGSRARVSRFWS